MKNSLENLLGLSPEENPSDIIELGNLATPNDWFAEKFPAIAQQYGEAVLIKSNREVQRVAEISEDFFSALLGEKGKPAAPAVYLSEERRFYSYDPAVGIYLERDKPQLAQELSKIMRKCADECESHVDMKSLEFALSQTKRLNNVLERAKASLRVPYDFFANDLTEFVACKNGMLRLQDRTLLPFNPSYRRRNKLGVDFVPDADCPIFKESVLRSALTNQDFDLFQRFFGLVLLGTNIAQVLVLLIGKGGDGKGVCIRVINGILGHGNVASLRTKLLGSRFEMGGFLGRTLLYGADVPPDFLNNESSQMLKSLTGGDPMTLELKGSNARPEITAQYNVVVTSNSDLRVRLDRDIEAWRRRLRIIRFTKPNFSNPIADLSEQILKTEASGVLNFMLDGLDRFRADGFVLKTTPEQQADVDRLLLSSQSHVCFLNEHIKQEPSRNLLLRLCFERYWQFCVERSWTPLAHAEFAKVMAAAVQSSFDLALRHDIPDHNGKEQRGWKGIAFK